MLRRNFVKLAALLAFPSTLFSKQEKTGYIADNPIKTEEEAAQELYRQFKKKDDFGCKHLQVTTSYTYSYKDVPNKCVTGVIIHWISTKPKVTKNIDTVNFSWDSGCVSVSTDYLDEEKLIKCIKKRFSDYAINRPYNVANLTIFDNADKSENRNFVNKTGNPKIFYAEHNVGWR